MCVAARLHADVATILLCVLERCSPDLQAATKHDSATSPGVDDYEHCCRAVTLFSFAGALHNTLLRALSSGARGRRSIHGPRAVACGEVERAAELQS